MEYMSGNIFIRASSSPMRKDELVLGHRHNFDHTTVVLAGALEVSLLTAKTVNAAGNPLDADVEWSQVIRAGDQIPWVLILKGRFHMLRALEDGTRYGCFYAHQMPQALTVENPGERHQPPYTKRDNAGVLWVRVDEKIVQGTAGFQESYR